MSEEVDKKLEEQKQAYIPFRLAPQDWKSGDIPWLLAVVAPQEAGLALIKKLEDSVFKDKTLKRFSTAMLGGTNAPQPSKNEQSDNTSTSRVTLP